VRALYLAIGPGRTASTALSLYFDSLRVPGLTVTHEYLGVNETRPIDFFRSYGTSDQSRLLGEPHISDFVALLDSMPADQAYMDLGWTLYPLVPALLGRYGDKVQVVILARHPLIAAASHSLRGLYEDNDPAIGGYAQALLEPSNARVFHSLSPEEWQSMTPFMRNLWRVNEILSYGLEVQRRFPQVEARVFRLEDYGERLGWAISKHFNLGKDAPEIMPSTNESQGHIRAARGLRYDDWVSAASWGVWHESAQAIGYSVGAEAVEELRLTMGRYEPQGVRDSVLRALYNNRLARRVWRELVVPISNKRAAKRRVGTVFENVHDVE
jgi:hypothetical protein